MEGSRLLIGVSAGIDRVHSIVVREEAGGMLWLMGEHRYREVLRNPDQTTLVERIRRSVVEAVEDAQVSMDDVAALGVATMGQIDTENGILLLLPRYNLTAIPMRRLLQNYFDLPISLLNIVDAQGIGEHRIGAGKNISNLVYIHVGYHIGSSLLISGQLYKGTGYLGGELGHTIVDIDGPECECGNRGCLDAIASGPAMGKKMRRLVAQGRNSLLKEALMQVPSDVSGAMIADAIDQEDELTIEVVEEAARSFGLGLANIFNLLNPGMVILGGEVINEIDLFFETAVSVAREKYLYRDIKNMSIVRGMLGTTAGAYGAAVYARQALQRKEDAPSS
ncbi:ROK family protein [Ktedonosporobacter rubrisoli]|uniref:ROK family protein n=1 Tax=Ktedonosporobacter rubrisoli TaxID=2509675 RepID=A0A4V0YZJ3_KTERU|nr:ROK family protein [Ktedonosporobacter rubrisoli]QBD79921.1 ROK family protein [Ktedonosporobacter rubrisoli]